MADFGHPCDADSCTAAATQSGTPDIPGDHLELRLCDHHVADLGAGKVRSLTRERGSDGFWKRPVVFFTE